ncbi:MAG TPA: hypothetical protein PKX81_06200 [Gemmiger formicilis]|nr:hypothetical protein [Gemmiger formicilis]
MEKKPESIFINRELSWLDFDSRVLALAKEKTVPLGERIKFAAIFGSNMDEFFMVRVGSLYDQTLLKNNKTDNVTHMTAAEQIAAITPRVAELQAKCDKYFQHLVSALAQEGYKKVDFAKLAKPLAPGMRRSISGKPISSASCCRCSARRSSIPATRSRS